MEPRQGDGPGTAVRDPDPSEDARPVRSRPPGTPDDDDREQGDAECYAVLGED